MNYKRHIPQEVGIGGRILAAAAFWKNDQPSGLGLNFPPDLPSREMVFKWLVHGCEALRKDWNNMSEADQFENVQSKTEFLGTLGKAKQRGETLGDEDCILAFCIIWLLEQVGAIGTDESNGCIFMQGAFREDLENHARRN